MNSNKIIQAAAVFIGLLIALFVTLSAFSDTRVIGKVYKYIVIAGIVLSIGSPKAALGILLLSSGYLDMFKRLLAVEGGVSFLDVIIILAFPPICVAAAWLSCTYQGLLLQKQWNPLLKKYFIISSLAMGVLGVGGLASQGFGLGGLRTAANSGAYAALIFIIPYLYRNVEEVQKTIKWLVILSVPIALYGLSQKYYGFSKFEIDYLNTGLSSEIRILLGQDYRVFSTLNSSQNLCKVMAVMAALVLIPLRGELGAGRWLFSLWWRLPLFGLFSWAAVASGSRTGLVMGAVVLLLCILYRFKVATLLFYVVGFGSVASLVVAAPRLAESDILAKLQGSLGRLVDVSSDEEARTFQLTTLHVRLRSMSLLSEPDYWTPFGAAIAKKKYLFQQEKIHDIVTLSIVRLGYIPFFFGLFALITVLWKSHRFIDSLPKGSSERRICILAIAMAASTVVGALSASANLETYPINYYLYLFIGFGIVANVQVKTRRAEEAREKKAATEPAPALGMRRPRPIPA